MRFVEQTLVFRLGESVRHVHGCRGVIAAGSCGGVYVCNACDGTVGNCNSHAESPAVCLECRERLGLEEGGDRGSLPSMEIRYVLGDATYPEGTAPRVLCHCVNDVGMWGSGFVLALKKWPRLEKAYRHWARGGVTEAEHPLFGAPEGPQVPFALGQVQFVEVVPDLWVANIVGQHRIIQLGEAVPVRYEALETGFGVVAAFCQKHGASAHMPRLGAGLARGSWPRIEGIIDRSLVARGISATVYDLEK